MHDIGTDRLSWSEFRTLIKHHPLDGSSALYRAQHPRSWHWSTEVEMLALVMHALHGANWQRAGSKGTPPEPMRRPIEARDVAPPPRDAVPLKSIRDELAKRRSA